MSWFQVGIGGGIYHISRAKLLSFSGTIFINELKIIKQTLINNGFPNYIVDIEIKHVSNKTE